MRPSPVAILALLLSGVGYPLTEVALERGGRRGAILVEAVCAGLAGRDAALVAAGAPQRLRRLPAALLRLEFGAALAAAALGAPLLLGSRPPGPLEHVRRGAVGTMFGMHTYRFWTYLQPDRGLRPGLSRLTGTVATVAR